MAFEVKYDLRHKAILVAGGYWTLNEKEVNIQDFPTWITEFHDVYVTSKCLLIWKNKIKRL
jgi:hypothetical protein